MTLFVIINQLIFIANNIKPKVSREATYCFREKRKSEFDQN